MAQGKRWAFWFVPREEREQQYYFPVNPTWAGKYIEPVYTEASTSVPDYVKDLMLLFDAALEATPDPDTSYRHAYIPGVGASTCIDLIAYQSYRIGDWHRRD